MKPILIIGGGIGGLALGVALRKLDIPITLFEKSPRSQKEGAGISLWPNAMKALRRINLEEEVKRRGALGFAGDLLTWHGKSLVRSTPAPELLGQLGVVGIHRGELLDTLTKALGEDHIHLDAECTEFEETPEGIRVLFADGKEEQGSLLVGADGIHSRVREKLFGPQKPRYSGYLAWRGIAHLTNSRLINGHGFIALGPGSQFGAVHIGGGKTYWFGTKNGPPQSPYPKEGLKKEVLDQFRSWTDPIEALIEETEETSILRNDIIDRPPTKDLGKGNTTLLGDAAHATTPNLGQGGCQALEDAIILAHCLKENGPKPETLRQFETLRLPRTTMITKRSWTLGRILQIENRGIRFFRDLAFRLTPKKVQIRNLRSMVNVELPEL